MISPHDSPQVKVAKGAAVIFAGLVFARIVNYAYQSLLSRAGGQGELGLFLLGATTLAVASGIAVLGIDVGVARFAPLYIGAGDEGKLRTLLHRSLSISMLNGLLSAAILALCASPLAEYVLNEPGMTGIIKICALCLPFSVVNRVLIKAVVAFQKIGYRVSINQVASPLVRLVLTAVLLAAGMRAEGAMWAFAASEVISFLALAWVLQRRVYPIFGGHAGGGGFDASAFFNYCLPLFLSAFVVQALNSIDIYMVSYFLGADEVGLYGAAVRLTALIAIGTELLSPLFLSITASAYAQGRDELVTGTFNSNNRWLMYITVPILCMLALFGGEAMSLVWGHEFMAGATALVLLVCGRAVYYISSNSSSLLSMYGRSKLILGLNVVSAVANYLLNLFLIPRYGILGAAIGTSISLVVSSLITISAAKAMHKGGPLQVFFPRLLAAAAVSCMPPLAIKFAGLPPLATVLIAGVMFCAAFLYLLKAFGVLDEEDRRIWQQILRRVGFGGQSNGPSA